MIRRGNPDPVAAALAAERRRQGLTLCELSQLFCGNEAARTRLSMWERGLTSPTLTCLRRWARALGVDVYVDAVELDPEEGEEDGL